MFEDVLMTEHGGGRLLGLLRNQTLRWKLSTCVSCPAVLAAIVCVEDLLGSSVVLQSCDRAFQRRSCDHPVTSCAAPAFPDFEDDPHHVSDHGATLPGWSTPYLDWRERETR